MTTWNVSLNRGGCGDGRNSLNCIIETGGGGGVGSEVGEGRDCMKYLIMYH